MSNTLTGLIPTLYTALDIVRRELIGFIPNVSMDAKASGAAVGQTVTAHVVPQGALEDITPGVNPASSGDQTIGTVNVAITKSKAYPIRWNGEEQLQLSDNNGQYNAILADQFAQGFRTLANAVETDLGALYSQVARAVGTAGTTPFSTADNHSDWAAANEALDNLGAPQAGRVMIVNSAARAKIEGIQSGLFHVNEAGDAGAMLRDRQMRQIHGFTMGYSAGIASHTAGTGDSYQTSAAAAAGDTTISIDTGTGTILAGDTVSFAGHSAEYVVKTALSGGDFVLADGLAAAVADNEAVTVNNTDFAANLAYHRNALLLATRHPAMPDGGDSADDMMTLTDPVSGLSFQVCLYRQYKQIKYELGLAWGVAAPNGKFGAILRG